MDGAQFLQVLIVGLSQGCVYGLIALGFVLIYKATEVVNFAQGDLMMIGMFVAFTFLNVLGMPYWLGLVCTCASMALIGALLERALIRPMIGEPTFAVLMLTVGLGFILRSFASSVWGADPKAIHNPFSGEVLAPVSLIDPQVGFIGIKAFAAAIIGGLGSLPGALIAGIAIGIIEQFAQIALPTGLATASPYLVMLIMLIVRPSGLFASVQRKKV